jgi:hypothetical protein
MNVSAGKRTFNIFSLFLHDSDESGISPFDGAALREWLNKRAAELYPEYYVEFQSPDDAFASSHWYVRFALDRWVHDMKPPEAYPNGRDYTTRSRFGGVSRWSWTRCCWSWTRKISPCEEDFLIIRT